MNFRRTAKRLLERQVLVDTMNKSYTGKLIAVETDYMVLNVKRTGDKRFDQIIVRISEIVAISTL
jgi:hypothetical protein